MIRLEDFWSISKGPVYYIATGDMIDSEEMLKHRNDEVIAVESISVYDSDRDVSFDAIGVEIDTP